MDIMTAEHPRWVEFCKRLEGPEGCNFRQTDPDDPDTLVWRCSGGPDRSRAKAILEDMGCDIEQSCDYFEDNGGYCDCEILFNVRR